MTTRETLCDRFDLPYSTQDDVLFDCCMKYLDDSEVDEDTVQDLEDKVDDLKNDVKTEKTNNKELQKDYNQLMANYKLMTVSFGQLQRGNPEIIDKAVWKLPIWEELRKESEE